MYNITIISTLHILVAIIQLTLAGIAFLADRKARINQSLIAALIFFSILSFSISMGMNSLTLNQSLVWMFVQSISIYDMGLVLLLVTLFIFRPTVVKHPIVLWPIICVISLPILSLFLDFSGVSQFIFGKHLMISISAVSQIYTGGYLSINDYITGILSPWLRIQIIASYAITGIYPLLTTAIKDRKSNPENSKFALILFFTTTVIGPITMLLLGNLPPTIPSLLADISFTMGFAYIVIQRSEARFGLPGIARMVQDYPMFNKLLATTIGIVLPVIFFVGFSSFSFYQQTLLNLYDDSLTNYAITEGILINQEFESLIQQLTNLSEETQIQLQLSERSTQLQEVASTDILSLLKERETTWHEEGNRLKTDLLRTNRTAALRYFIYDNPAFRTLLVTDEYGGLVVASESPENYDQSQQSWWRWVRTTRQTYIGTPFWDEVSQVNLVEIAIPIFPSADNSRVTGVMYSLFDMTPIEEVLIQSSEGQITNLALLNADYSPVINRTSAPQENTSNLISTMTFDTEKKWHVINYNNEDNIAVIEKIENDKTKNNLNLNILALAPIEEALSSVFIARNGIFLLITVMLFIAIGATVVLANLITNPLIELTQTAEKILRGEKNIRAEVSGSDEIGTLASTFNRMTSEMNNLVNSLESTVEERTGDLENRAWQLETAALVARESAEIHDLQKLLNQVVHLVSERFGFYHAGIFLLDERGEYAILQAANSEGGQKMLSRGHKLQVGKVGVVGYTAGSGKPRIAQDVGADVIYYDNPDMPNTRSELALPLVARGAVIGVLDVQSNQANAFKREDLEVLQILADQIALAIENAKLLQTSQRTLIEIEQLYGRQISQAWKQQLSGHDLIYRYDPVGVDYNPRDSERELINKPNDENGNKLSKEISFRGQVIGTIDLLRDSDQGNWSEDEESLVEEILEQTAQALENARLLNEIRLRSDQIQLLQEITALSASLMNEEKLLDAVVQKLYKDLELLECSIVLFDDDRKYSRLVTKATDSNTPPSVGSMLALEVDNISREMNNRKSTLILYDVKSDLNSSTYTQTFSPANTFTTILLPLMVRGEVVGMINMEIDDPEREIDNEDLSLFAQIHSQISTALESSRSFTAEQRGRQAAAALLEISQIASSSLDINFILKEVAQRSAAAIQAHRCTILLIDNEKNTFRVMMSMFADPQHTDDRMWNIFKTMEDEKIENLPIYQQIYLNRRYAVLDVAEQPDMMPSRWVEPLGIKKLLLIPLISQDEVFGVITFDQIDEEATFTPEQIDLAQTISGQVASTIENAYLFDLTVRRAERERLVAEMTTKIRASNDPNVIINTAINELREALIKTKVQIAMHSDSETHQDNLESNGE
jgi:GAF domain-containing protein/HAMP domain-containing protein